jgi:ribosome recycling factor
MDGPRKMTEEERHLHVKKLLKEGEEFRKLPREERLRRIREERNSQWDDDYHMDDLP